MSRPSPRAGDSATAHVIGAGPNGLAAAVVLARAGIAVTVYEAADAPGGGARSAELLEPGCRHDLCSAVHPNALASEFFRRFGLTARMDFVVPDLTYAQARLHRPAVLAWRDVDRTASGLGSDTLAWRQLFGPLVARAEAVARITSDNPIRAVTDFPTALRFGLRALGQWQPLAALRPLTGAGADLLSGVEAHTNHRLSALSTTFTALTLATYGHTVGWPIPVGGSQIIVDAMVDDLTAHGGTITTGQRVRRLAELPPASATLFDTSVPDLLDIAGGAVPAAYRAAARLFAGGAGVGKVDYLLSEPVPWSDEMLGRAATVHLGGVRADVAAAERAVSRGRIPQHPVVIASEPTRFDPGRAPGRHVLWAYTHLPAGSSLDPTAIVTGQLERYAPGFTDTIVNSVSHSPAQLAEHNPNYLGGDIYAGDLSTRQVLVRPVPALDPWRVGRTDLYLCSSAAAPGPGVHGMGGFRAATSALRHSFGVRTVPDLAP